MSIEFQPLIPMSLWLALAAVAAGAVGWYALRRPTVMGRGRWALSIGLMGTGLALIFALLLNPILSHPLPPPEGKPVLTVLIDQSGSMATADGGDNATRYAAAAKLARQMQNAAGDTFEVRARGFDRSLRTIDIGALDGEPAGAATDLSGAIAGAVSGESMAGEAVVLLSDGIHNAGGGSAQVLDAVRVARAMDAPIFTRTLGGDARQADVSVELRSSQDLTIVGQRTPVTARVQNVGFTTAHASVALLRDGQEIARKTADVAAGSGTDLHFSVMHDQAGVYPYQVRVDPVQGETSQANNSAAYVLRVVAEPVRVLVLEGKPYWDNKFFLRTLVNDPAVAIDSVVKLTDARLLRRVLTHKAREKSDEAGKLTARDDSWQIATDSKAFLEDPQRLRTYQIVVLGRDSEPFLSKNAIANLQDWIARDGGSLVCYRGAPTALENDSLAKLMPVKWSPGNRGGSRFRLSLTEPGESTEWLRSENQANDISTVVAGMPSLATSAVVDSSKPLAVVLANSVSNENAQSPAVVYQPYGSGRVVVIEGGGMWRWAFLAPKFQDQQSVYGSLWHSLLRWLTSGAKLQPGQNYSLRSDKVRFGASEPATATVLTRENTQGAALPQVELVAEATADANGAAPPEKKLFAASLAGDDAGVYRVNFGALPEGRYRASLSGARPDDASAQVVFEVRSFDREQLDLRARPDLMERIARDSGGAVLGDDVVAEVKQKFVEYRAKTHPPQVTRTPAWDRWWILAGIIGVWGLTWFIRRAGGLV